MTVLLLWELVSHMCMDVFMCVCACRCVFVSMYI